MATENLTDHLIGAYQISKYMRYKTGSIKRKTKKKIILF